MERHPAGSRSGHRIGGACPGLPPVEHDWRYEETEGGTKVTVTLASQEVDSWLGRAPDRLVLPHQLERDLERTLDHVEGLVEFELH